jgi:tol-pal system beta propeller repeat protein TolB
VFHSDRDGHSQIYVMNADGSDQRRLTNNSWADRNPTWSPDGRQIAFQRDHGNFDIYVMNADGTGERQLTTAIADDIDPAWSPDGRQIAFASRRDASTFQIYVMDLAGNAQRLTNSPGQEFNPAWAPNGRKLAFHSNRDGVSSKIYLMNPDGTSQTPLTTTASDDLNPAWAPDGQELVFQRLHGPGPLYGLAQLYVVSVGGNILFRLTDGTGDDLVPDW